MDEYQLGNLIGQQLQISYHQLSSHVAHPGFITVDAADKGPWTVVRPFSVHAAMVVSATAQYPVLQAFPRFATKSF